MAGSQGKKEEDVLSCCESSDGEDVDGQASISQTGELSIPVLLRVAFVAELTLTILFTFM
jgi:hypothetical protein